MIPLIWYLLITPIGFLLIILFRLFLGLIKYDHDKSNKAFIKQIKFLAIIWVVIGVWLLISSLFGV